MPQQGRVSLNQLFYGVVELTHYNTPKFKTTRQKALLKPLRPSEQYTIPRVHTYYGETTRHFTVQHF